MNASNTTTGTDVTGHLLGTAERPVIHVERWLRATPAEVWDAWTDPTRMARWIGAVDAPLTTPGQPVRMAMAAAELPDDFDDAENPTTLTVREAVPPSGDSEGRLVFTFDDTADPGGFVTITMRPIDDGCLMTLRHALVGTDRSLEYSSGFGAGWESFLDWLEDVLATGEHGPDPAHDHRAAPYEQRRDRLARVHAGTVDGSTVRQERIVAAPIETVWDLVASADGLGQWLGRVSAGTPDAGATITVIHDESSPATSTQTSEITAWDPPHHLAMSWSYSGEATSAVDITLSSVEAGTRLVLVHDAVAADVVDDYLAGWHAHLDVLVGHAEGFAVPPFALAYGAVR